MLFGHRTRIYCFAFFNAAYWVCAFGLFLILFVSLFFIRDLKGFYLVPSVIGILFLCLCAFAVLTTCSLPISSEFYYPQPNIIQTPEIVEIKEQDQKPEQI